MAGSPVGTVNIDIEICIGQAVAFGEHPLVRGYDDNYSNQIREQKKNSKMKMKIQNRIVSTAYINM